MKKIITLVFIIVAMATIGAFAQDSLVSINWAKRIPGTDSVIVNFQKLRADSMTTKFRFSTDSLWGGMVAENLFGYMDSTIGVRQKTVYLPAVSGSTIWYLRMITRDSSTHSYDTSRRKIVMEAPDVSPALATTLHGFNQTVVARSVGDTIVVTHTLCYDTLCTTTFTHRVEVITTYGAYTAYVDSITTLPTGFHAWEKVKWSNVHGHFPADSTVTPFTTGVAVTIPYVHGYGYPSISHDTIGVPIVTNIWGSTGAYAKGYIRPFGTSIWSDSVMVPLSAIVGAQYPVISFHGLAPADTYYVDVKVVNSAGYNWLGTHTYITHPAPISLPTFYVEDSIVTYDASTGVATMFVNMDTHIGYYADVTVEVIHNGVTLFTTPYSGIYGATTLTPTFILSDTGIYLFKAWGNEPTYPGGPSSYGATLVLHVTAPMPVANMSASITDGHVGDMPTFYWWSNHADIAYINGSMVSDSGHYTFPVPLMNDTTIYFVACNSSGCDTAIWNFHAVDLPNSVTQVKEIAIMNVYPNPTAKTITIKYSEWAGKTYLVQDVLGKIIAQIPATGVETTYSCDSLSAGMFVITIDEQKIKFIKQ